LTKNGIGPEFYQSITVRRVSEAEVKRRESLAKSLRRGGCASKKMLLKLGAAPIADSGVQISIKKGAPGFVMPDHPDYFGTEADLPLLESFARAGKIR
jgi:hypothetical protein